MVKHGCEQSGDRTLKFTVFEEEKDGIMIDADTKI